MPALSTGRIGSFSVKLPLLTPSTPTQSSCCAGDSENRTDVGKFTEAVARKVLPIIVRPDISNDRIIPVH